MTAIKNLNDVLPDLNRPSSYVVVDSGKTLRDEFAAVALLGWFISYAQDRPKDSSFATIAKTSYMMADAMMKQREVK